MFSGIVTDVGRVRAIRDTNRDRRFEIETSFDVGSIDIGASISHAGCCLTVVEKGAGWYAVEVSGETLGATTLAGWREGGRVNLERAARVGDELGGHIVSGHVDGVGEVLSVTEEGGSHRVSVRVPRPLHRYIAPKGSITVDGVSLTVNDVREAEDGSTHFSVNIIPHTTKETTLHDIEQGRQLNVEVDVLARYIDRMLAARAQ